MMSTGRIGGANGWARAVSGRRSRTIKSWWIVVAFLCGFALAMAAEELILNWHDNLLEFSAPRVHFLNGKALDRLHDGAEVPFDFQATLWSGNHNHVFKKIRDRFVVSYDVWQEDFKVTSLEAPRKAKGHLTAVAAEAWCVQQMSMNVSGISHSETIWARLEIRAGDGKDTGVFGRGNISESGISLNSLIEVFSRPAPATQAHWAIEAGPMTLDELKRSHARGS